MYAQRSATGVRLVLEGVELRLLDDLLMMLSDLVGQVVPESSDQPDDPFAFWEAQHQVAGRTQRDPALARLFPAASADAEADRHLGEFSRVIVSQQRLDELATVRADIAARRRFGRVEIERGHVDAWLRTLNAVNLVLTARIGIVDGPSADEVMAAVIADDDDPRAMGFHVHQWLAGTMESILDVL